MFLLTRHNLHYEFATLVVVHVQEDPSFVVQMDFKSLHHVLVLEFLAFGHELFHKFVHLRVDVVYIPFFEHQQETTVED